MHKTFNAVFARRFLLLLVLSLCGCGASTPEHVQLELTGRTMGTTYSIKFLPGDRALDVEAFQQIVDNRLAEINAVMSTYDPKSELSRLNRRNAPKSAEVSDELMQVLQAASRVHMLSQGAFDPSVGPLVNLWGFGPETVTAFPNEAEIRSHLELVGYSRVHLDKNNRQVTRPAGMVIDLSAIAKGYGVDQVAQILDRAGYTNYLVEIGGELRASGANASNKPWHIAIEKPVPGQRQVHGIINVSGLGMATSGDYRNFFEKDGQRYSHTLDPRTGYPVRHSLVSVTVLADDCMTADALATAFMVMGREKAAALAEAEEIAAWFIEQSGTELVDTLTPKMQSYRLN